MVRFFLPFLLLLVFFILPLHVYVIGGDTGIGIQGAVYRYQVTVYGNSLIPVTQDIVYVVNGIYTGKTALSVIFWATGTICLTVTTWYGLVYADSTRTDFTRKISVGLAGSCILFLMSCIAQYGLLFHGPAGTSIPFGIVIILGWLGILRIYPDPFSALQ